MTTLNDSRYNLDLLIVARGGGSFEDLFCFSEEAVVRAIFKSQLPVVTGIGHEPDFSLADAVADHSASTPTAAAEMATPDLAELLETLDSQKSDLLDEYQYCLQQAELTFDSQATRSYRTLRRASFYTRSRA